MCTRGREAGLNECVQFLPLPSAIINKYLHVHRTLLTTHKAGGKNVQSLIRDDVTNDASK